jgi:hypothetical protein
MKDLAALLVLLLTIVVYATDNAGDDALVARILPPFNANAPKRGLSYKSAKWLQNFHGSGSQVSWAYNWVSDIDPTVPASLEFVPMLWSDSAGHTSVVSGKLSVLNPDSCSPLNYNTVEKQCEQSYQQRYYTSTRFQ